MSATAEVIRRPAPVDDILPTGSEFASGESPFAEQPFVAVAVAEDVIVLQLAEDDAADRPDPTVSRTAFAGMIVSLLVHLWLGTNLAGLFSHEPSSPSEPVILSKLTEPALKQEIEEAIPFELANPNDREMDVREVTNAISVGLAQVVEPPKIAAAPRQLLEEARVDLAKLPSYDIPEGMQFDDRLVVKGSTGEQLVQIESALDRVTWEIAQNLQESKLLVVWLIDGSASLMKQREAIVKRLNRIYGELGALESTSVMPSHERGLLTGVVMFGEKTHFVTDPTVDFEKIRQGFEKAPTDASGIENVFTAVTQVMKLWSRYRTEQGRRIMLITITDEAGDDFGRPHLEAIALCRRYGAKVYVIGPTAIFGRRQGFIPYVAPENGQTYQLPIDLGPEAPMSENVVLPFWFAGPQYDYLSSGFAPYALARLVSETGGVYFLTNMTTMSGLTPIGSFDEATLKTFAPDYRFGEPEEFARDLQKHPIRYAVIQAAQLSQRFKAKGTPQLNMRVTANNFKQLASEAQKTAAESQYMIDAILQAFPPGIENQLDREPSLRWRMAFCLNYGRLLGNRVRNLEYNYALANIKNNLTANDVSTKSNLWIFHPHPEVKNSGVAMRKTAALASDLLNRVVAEAPGTPWALLAARELKDPFGIRVEERFVPVPSQSVANSQPPTKAKPRPLFQEDPKKKAEPPKPPPKPPVLPKL